MNILGYDRLLVSLIVLILNKELETSNLTACDVATNSQKFVLSVRTYMFRTD